MLRSALLIGAGLLAALAAACVPPQMAPPPPPPAPPLPAPVAAHPAPPPPTTAGICTAGQPNSGDTFAAAVQVLQPNYNPQSHSPPENNVQAYSLRKEITDDLSAAFNNAPAIIQNRLCGMTGVYINPTGCANNDVNNCYPFNGNLFLNDASWGFRGTGPSKGNTYIAISAGLWYLGGYLGHYPNAESFSTYENSILQTFASWSGGPSIASATPDYSWMTVLAALAHELGHVRRAEVAIPTGYGKAYNFSALTSCSIGGGQTIDFYSGWNYGGDKKKLEPPSRWRHFGDKSNANNTTTDHSNAPYLVGDLNTNQTVDQLYQSLQPNPFNPTPYDQPWPSLFGAQNPDEDFAETYVLYALMGNKLDIPNFAGDYLQNLPVTIPLGLATDTRDVPSDLLAGFKPTLLKKIQCLEKLP